MFRRRRRLLTTDFIQLATGTLAPPTSVTRLQYMCRKIPWFGLYDEHIPSISQGGQFQNVQSIDEIDYQMRRVKRARLMPGSEEREFDRDRLPQCDVCLKGIACVVLRPCSHCVCGTCLSKTALGGTTCLKCSTRIFGYVGFATPARNIISSDDPAFKITDVFIDAPLAEDVNHSSVITLHLSEDEPTGLRFGALVEPEDKDEDEGLSEDGEDGDDDEEEGEGEGEDEGVSEDEEDGEDEEEDKYKDDEL